MHFHQVFRSLHEGQRDPVDVGFERGGQVGAVLLGQGAGGQDGVGQADALAIGNLATDLDLGDRHLAVVLDDAQPEAAVVDQQAVAGLERVDDLRMRQRDAGDVAIELLTMEGELRADLQEDRTIGEGADAQLGALQVGEDADGAAGLGLDLANGRHVVAQLLVVGVAHVDAEAVRTRLVEPGDHVLVGGGGAQSCKNLDLAVSSHFAPFPFWVGW